jgi:autotransporter-associated beta strand protein
MNPISRRATPGTLLAITLPVFLASHHHAAQLVNWDVPTGTATSALTSAVASGLSASPITLSTGLNLNSASLLWRTRGYNDSTTRFITFSITASPGNTVTLESLAFTANAQAGSGSAWTAPTLRLDFSTDATFASGVVEAGSLSLGPDLAASTTGTPVAADATSFFPTDLVINGGETYYFRLVGLGANSGAQNQISYNSANDMQLSGSVASSSSDLVWAGADGANWNTTQPNFTKGGNPATFTTHDNVTVQTPGAINLDPGGITAGILIHSSNNGTTTLGGGDLTTSTLVKSGGGMLAVASPVEFSTGPGTTTLSGGTLQILDGASFSTAALNLSGGATLQVATSGLFASSGPNTLGSGGGTISNDSAVTLANITNSTPGTPLAKSGVGVLTLSGIGTQITGPVDLDITAGSVVANGPVGSARQINIIGTNVLDGNLTLNGPVLMLHGSTVSGSGSIIMSNATSSITSRLNAGAVAVGVPVTLTADANVESPNGGNILHLNAPITGDFGLTKKGNGIVVLAASNSHTTTTIEAGTLRVGAGTAGTLGTGAVSVGSTGTLSFNRDDITTVANDISGPGRVTMAGGNAASVELTGTNLYTGVTTVTSGTLNAPVLSNGDQPGSIGASSSDAANIVLNGGTLAHTGPATTCDRGFTLGIVGGTIAANGTGPLTLDYTGGIGLIEPNPVTVGNLTIGNNYKIVDPGDTNFVGIGAANNNPGTTFTATGPGTGTGTVVFANTRPLRLAGSAAGIHELAATIADASNAPTSLTKNGTNTWSITATNIYTGTTRINAGTLRIDGDNSAATGPITVADTGSLGGNGRSGGQVILESGGGLAVRITDWTGAPGTGYHDLAVAGLDAAVVPMRVTIDTSGLANFTDSAKSFTILTASGGISIFNPANVTFTAPGFPGTGFWSLTQSGNSLLLSYALGGNYSTWAAANGIPGEPSSGDFDRDGLTNLVEYALGLNPTASSVPPGTFSGGTLSFTKGTEARANGDVIYEIEQSTTLGNWTVVVPDSPASPTISHTLPAGQPRHFARLKVTRIP